MSKKIKKDERTAPPPWEKLKHYHQTKWGPDVQAGVEKTLLVKSESMHSALRPTLLWGLFCESFSRNAGEVG